MFDNFLPKALFISLAIHTVVICTGLLHLPKPKQAQVPQQVEITYRAQLPRPKADVRQRPIRPAQRLDLNNRASAADGTIPLKLGEGHDGLGNFMIDGPRPEQIRSVEMSHHVSIKPISSEKANNPAYTSYYEIIRHRIEEKAYENYSTRRMEAGTVYLTFVVDSKGILKDAKVIDERSNASQNLRDEALLSLRQAEFPPFKKGMILPEYTFNIEIQYQVHE